jgi:hypothetical protein
MSKAKGEVGFDADGERFTLSFSIDALCELEEAAGCSMTKIGETWADPSKPQLRLVKIAFWAALTENHPGLSMADAGKLMAAIGFVQASRLVLEAFALAFPESAKEGAPLPLEIKGGKTNGRRAPTGPRLTANG